MATARKNRSRREISFKVKHGIFWILLVVGVLVLISGISIYKYGDKVLFYKQISNTNKAIFGGCVDAACIISKINKEDIVSEEACSAIKDAKNKEICLSEIYKRRAIKEGDKKYCSNIPDVGDRDSCYMSLAVYYNNPSYCSSIEDSNLRGLCLNSLS